MAKNTRLVIRNFFSTQVFIKIPDVDPNDSDYNYQDKDWAGDCKPKNNLDGLSILSCESLVRREDYLKIRNPKYCIEFYDDKNKLLCRTEIRQKNAGDTLFGNHFMMVVEGVQYHACVLGIAGEMDTEGFDMLQITLSERKDGILKFSSVSDLHFHNKHDEENYQRANKIIDIIVTESPDFVFMQGDLTNGTNKSELSVFKYMAEKLEKCGIVVCEGWGNHDTMVHNLSADVTRLIKIRNEAVRADLLPSYSHEAGHYCFTVNVTNPINGYSKKTVFYMLNLFPGYGSTCNEYRSKDPFYSLDFMLKKLPDIKTIPLFISFHYPIRKMKQEGIFKDFETEIVKKYSNLFLLVGHDHDTSYVKPATGYSKKADYQNCNEFLCAGGLNAELLQILFCELQVKNSNALELNYRWLDSDLKEVSEDESHKGSIIIDC